MVRSMTGFGRYTTSFGERKFTVEIKAVNHRYLDFFIKLPRQLAFFEANVRNELKKLIGRGKVEVFVAYEDLTQANLCVKYNEKLANEYFAHLKQISKDFRLDFDIKTSHLSRYPEVFSMEEQAVSGEELWDDLREAIAGAALDFNASREREGEKLAESIREKLANMRNAIAAITACAPEIVTAYQKKLTEKISALIADTHIDEGRILTEVAIFADKACLDEELVRLSSHINAATALLESEGEIGRKLDFLVQEMNREANTISAKANDLNVTSYAIELKTEIEKIREQIQNIE